MLQTFLASLKTNSDDAGHTAKRKRRHSAPPAWRSTHKEHSTRNPFGSSGQLDCVKHVAQATAGDCATPWLIFSFHVARAFVWDSEMHVGGVRQHSFMGAPLCVARPQPFCGDTAKWERAMVERSDSETASRWRRTPSRARERSRSQAGEPGESSAGRGDSQRGEAPEGPQPWRASPTEPLREPTDKGRGRGRGRAKGSAGKSGKGSKGKFSHFAAQGGKSTWQRGEAPADVGPPEPQAGTTRGKGQGDEQGRLEEGELLRCLWPAAPGESFRAEGNLSFNDILDTVAGMGGKLEIRGRDRKNAGLQRVMILKAPPGQVDGVFRFVRAAARTHDPKRKLPKLAHCTRAEINIDGVLVHTLRRATTPTTEADPNHWLEFMKEPLATEFSSDSEWSAVDDEMPADRDAAKSPTVTAANVPAPSQMEISDTGAAASSAAEPEAIARATAGPRGEAPGARRGEAPERGASSVPEGALLAGTVGQESGPVALPAQCVSLAQTFGPPPVSDTELPSVLLPAEDVEVQSAEPFHDVTRTPRALFLQRPLTVAYQTCLRFLQDGMWRPCCGCCGNQ